MVLSAAAEVKQTCQWSRMHRNEISFVNPAVELVCVCV
jgi:hypothetical protein